jgi:transcription-repair coupling factor (superfamily II helicase)
MPPRTVLDFEPGTRTILAQVPDGADALVVADLVKAYRAKGGAGPIVVVLRDGTRLPRIGDGLSFFAPGLEVSVFPAWDCLPYDRVSPNAGVSSERMAALHRLASENPPDVLLTTINAALQRVPTRQDISARALAIAPSRRVSMEKVIAWAEENGFSREPTVREPAQYAVRGGILDLFVPGEAEPVRLDFFGDTLESIRAFDPETQRSAGRLDRLDLVPPSEAALNEESIRRFRQSYVEAFGVPGSDDPLYASISEGRRYQGLEHWLPLFHDGLATLFDQVPGAPIVFDALLEEARDERLEQIADHYATRREAMEGNSYGAAPYKPLPPGRLYLSADDWTHATAGRARFHLNPFAVPAESDTTRVVALEGRQGRVFAAERAAENSNVFEAVARHIETLKSDGLRVVIACWSQGSRDRMRSVLADHGVAPMGTAESWADVSKLPAKTVGVAVLPIESGFTMPDFALIAEQDILGDRLVRPRKRARRGEEVLREAASLTIGDVVVHADHGIGRFAGLETIQAAGAPHDCVELHYAGGDKLFLPVENIELLTRYGSDDAEVTLDKLGGGAWQARKARMKKRIRDMAEALIRVAAARALKSAPSITPPEGAYDEFAARFPYEETEDQLAAIEAVAEDLASGRPMDRLVCGDVGFGKTEVALRAAFLTAMSGRQVAVVVPTTLLARQHYRGFCERFRGLPVKVRQLSRLVGAKEAAETRAGVKTGDIDIVIGTHALLGKNVDFADLGLLVIDEEQHFGVKHKERLKDLKQNVHVLTLTATPIPRTLQLALAGVRELSLITTPPVDRLAVRTFIAPFDPVVVREAILREHYRGGQTFYVLPRLADIADVKQFLDDSVPEVRVAVAHGQMAAGELEDVMNAFYDGQYDVLLSTTIVESGLDIPRANTLVVHRADMFGLAQLYQLRGRVGRSKLRAYSLFTVPARQKLTPTAEKRLKVLQSLDSLGAGFTLASHDLDIRGAGNLLGEEQSGHIREVGYELYQQMLEEAVSQLKAGGEDLEEEHWSPQITLGVAVLIPESYVSDLSLRLSLYRRLSGLSEEQEIEGFAAELIDRFGPLPEEVEHLIQVMRIKVLCMRCGIERLDAGPKGLIVGFRDNQFANPQALVSYVAKQGSLVKVRPDYRLVFLRDWPKPEDRLTGSYTIVRTLAGLAAQAQAA